jgi:hypothetical protein
VSVLGQLGVGRGSDGKGHKVETTAGDLRHLRALVSRVAARLCAEPFGGVGGGGLANGGRCSRGEGLVRSGPSSPHLGLGLAPAQGRPGGSCAVGDLMNGNGARVVGRWLFGRGIASRSPAC